MEPAYDVFLSYARDDAARAAFVRDRLEAHGLRVFFDAEGIESGEEFPLVIDREVKSAKCVLALWSNAALSRRWVRIESRIGLDQSKLVAAMLDATRPEDLPAEFYNVNFERLDDFDGSDTHAGWRRVLRAIGKRTGRRDLAAEDPPVAPAARQAPPPRSEPRPQPAAPARPARSIPGWAWGVGLIAVGALVLVLMPREERGVVEPAPVAASTPAPSAPAPSQPAPVVERVEPRPLPPAPSLSGDWAGEYWGPAATRTPFVVTIREADGAFRGSLAERNTFARGAGDRLYADISGGLDEDGRLAFTKTYDGTGGVSHSVQYEGRANAARDVIVGTWRVQGNTGEFRMERR